MSKRDVGVRDEMMRRVKRKRRRWGLDRLEGAIYTMHTISRGHRDCPCDEALTSVV